MSQCLVVSERARQYELIPGSSPLRCQRQYHNSRGSFSLVASQPASHCLAFPSHWLKNCRYRLNLLHWSGWDFQPESSNPAVRENASVVRALFDLLDAFLHHYVRVASDCPSVAYGENCSVLRIKFCVDPLDYSKGAIIDPRQTNTRHDKL